MLQSEQAWADDLTAMIPADPALCWDTPPRPLASRAEPPNSAQPFLVQVLGPMKCPD